jgi:uncharacterized membrane-anchored protein
MTALAAFLGRIPGPVLFALAALVQVALIALLVADRARILRDGSEVTLKTLPVDPRDFLRGDYVALRYDISTVPAGALFNQPGARSGLPVYVKVAPTAAGYHQAVSIHLEPVPLSEKEVMIRGETRAGTDCGTPRHLFCFNIPVKYGLERYFVPQGEGREIESARNRDRVAIVAAVTSDGRAAIKRLLLDGKVIYDEPWF